MLDSKQNTLEEISSPKLEYKNDLYHKTEFYHQLSPMVFGASYL